MTKRRKADLSLGDVVRRAIERDPRTVNAIAVEAGVTPIMVWDFLKGTDCRISTVGKLCRVVGLELRPTR